MSSDGYIHGTKDLTLYAGPTESRARRCPVCGERFKAGPQWVYRTREKVFCRWNCQMAWEKAQAEKAKPQRRGARLNWRESVENAKARRAKCLQQIEFFKARQQQTTGQQNHKAAQNARFWAQELEDVEAFLKAKGESV